MRGYPKNFLGFLLITLFISLISGLLLIPTALELKFAISIYDPSPESLAEYLHLSHALFSFLILFIIGSLWSIHMRSGWHKKQNIITGLGLTLGFFILFLSGIGLYYFIDDTFLNSTSVIHIIIGIFIIILFIIHYLYARRLNLKHE